MVPVPGMFVVAAVIVAVALILVVAVVVVMSHSAALVPVPAVAAVHHPAVAVDQQGVVIIADPLPALHRRREAERPPVLDDELPAAEMGRDDMAAAEPLEAPPLTVHLAATVHRRRHGMMPAALHRHAAMPGGVGAMGDGGRRRRRRSALRDRRRSPGGRRRQAD
jgi:hypothetical protein